MLLSIFIWTVFANHLNATFQSLPSKLSTTDDIHFHEDFFFFFFQYFWTVCHTEVIGLNKWRPATVEMFWRTQLIGNHLIDVIEFRPINGSILYMFKINTRYFTDIWLCSNYLLSDHFSCYITNRWWNLDKIGERKLNDRSVTEVVFAQHLCAHMCMWCTQAHTECVFWWAGRKKWRSIRF